MRLDAPDETDEGPPSPRRNLAARLILIALLVPALSYVGYLAIALGPELAKLEWGDLLRGYHHTLMPAEMQGAPLRTAQGGADRVYVLTTQAERIVPIRLGRVSRMKARNMLHVDLWAFDPATAQPTWRRRIHTFEHDRGPLRFEMLGADAATLWLFIRKPLALSLHDGALLADSARLDAINPMLVDKHVDQAGYVAFGGQGLQLTLSDSTQWVVDGTTFTAQLRAAAPVRPDGLVMPAYDAPYASYFQLRGVPIGSRWLGVLTDAEAAVLRAPAVVPGAKPGERRGVAADFFERGHIPGDLSAQPLPYRVWSARLAKVSAAPPEWPKDWPDKWGTRDEYSDYQQLPEAPPFLQAGLLTDGRSKQAFWYREPDSVLVLHHDKLGDAGRLLVARVSGPAGRVVWDAPLTLADLDATMHGTTHVAFVGTTPNPAYDPESDTSREEHQKIIALDIATGGVASYDLSAESVAAGADQLLAGASESAGTAD